MNIKARRAPVLFLAAALSATGVATGTDPVPADTRVVIERATADPSPLLLAQTVAPPLNGGQPEIGLSGGPGSVALSGGPGSVALSGGSGVVASPLPGGLPPQSARPNPFVAPLPSFSGRPSAFAGALSGMPGPLPGLPGSTPGLTPSRPGLTPLRPTPLPDPAP